MIKLWEIQPNQEKGGIRSSLSDGSTEWWKKKKAAKSSGNTTARLVDMSSQAPQMLLILGLKEDQGFDTMLETSHLRSLSRAALAEKGILDTAGCDPY